MVGPGEVVGGLGQERGQAVDGHPQGDGVGKGVGGGRAGRPGALDDALHQHVEGRGALGPGCGIGLPLPGLDAGVVEEDPVPLGPLGGVGQVGAATGVETVDRVGEGDDGGLKGGGELGEAVGYQLVEPPPLGPGSGRRWRGRRSPPPGRWPAR